MADGKVVIDVILDDGSVAKGVANLDGKFKGLGGAAKSSAASIGNIVKALGLVAIASKAIDMVKSSLDGAISRYDTLNNFPRVLQLMGFDAKESQKAIDKLADGIDGLPTTLDSVAKTTQRIALMTGDLDGATDTTLALNNAFLASGASAADAERGLEQYVQMLSKGEVDLQSWRTLQETMPIALNETAKAFGFTGKSAQNDLYDALKEGDITFDKFNDKIIELSNKTGGFADIARESSGGIKTAWTNMNTAIVKGVADVIGAIDKALGGVGSIEGIINKVKDGIKIAFAAIAAAVPIVVAKIQDFKAKLEEWKPVVDRVKDAFAPFATAIIGANQKLMSSLLPIWESLKGLFKSLLPILELIGAAILSVAIPAWAILISTWNGVIAALGPLINALINLADFIVNTINFVIAVLTGDFAGAMDYWTALTQSSIDFFVNLWDGVVSFFKGFIDTIVGFFHGLYMTLVGNSIIPDMVNAIIQWFQYLFSGLVSIVMSIVNGVKAGFNLMRAGIVAVINNIKNIIKSGVNFWRTVFSTAIAAIRSVVSTGFNFVRSFITSVINTVRNVISKGFNSARSVVSRVTNSIRSVISSGFNAVRSIVTTVINTIRSVISAGFNAARSVVSSVTSSIRSVVSSVFNALAGIVRGAMTRVSSAVGNGMRSALKTVTNIARSFYNAGRNIVTSIANGIKSAIGKVTGAISSVTSRIRNFLPFSPAKEGALRDIMKVRISESIAQAIDKGKPKAIKAMKGLTDTLASEMQPELGLLGNIKGLSANSLIGSILPLGAIQANVTSKENNSNAGVAGLLREQNQILTKLLQKNQDLYIDGEKVTDVVNTNNAVIAAMTKF